MQAVLENQKKGNKNTTISDNKAFGFAHAFLILKQHVDVRHKDMALYCDNKSTVS